MSDRQCPTCQRPVEGAAQKRFCSTYCQQRANRRRKNPHAPRACTVCEAMLRGRQQLYCSKSCENKIHHTKARRLKGQQPDRQERQCEWCHLSFTSRRAFQLYCCERCRGSAMDLRRREELGYAIEEYKPTEATIKKLAANIRANKVAERTQQHYAGRKSGKGGWRHYGNDD